MKLKNNEFKTLEIKAMKTGEISFYASVFDVEDSHGDMTHKGTFVETKKKFDAGEISVDLRLEHKTAFKTVGAVTEMEIDDHGLKCKAVFIDSPIGRKVHSIAKNVFETKSQEILFSIGFITLKDSQKQLEGKTVRSLDDVLLGEVSIVEKPSNVHAKVLEVKAELEEDELPVVEPETPVVPVEEVLEEEEEDMKSRLKAIILEALNG